jgi:hypothetical protein
LKVVRRLLQWSVVAGLLLAVGAVSAPAGRNGLAAPGLIGPPSGGSFLSLPAFAWRAIAGAQHYEFQISADPSFNSPVFGGGQDRFTTRNTFATLPRQTPNGTYWWHVRAIDKNGAVGPWSPARSAKRAWTTAPRPMAPANNAQINYGTSRLTLSWTPVPYASKYLVSIGTTPDLGNLISGDAQETNATSFTPSVVLSIGTYFWSVQPEDADGNRGTPSKVVSFNWRWPSKVASHLTDLVSAPEFYDPQLSWNSVPGAAHYDVEINPATGFPQGSKVCCDNPAVGTKLSPTASLKNNRYYARIRAVDIDGDAGAWYPGPTFTKAFDLDPDGPGPKTSIPGLHVRDNLSDPGSSPPGFLTSSPIVVWQPVTGAASYEVDVVPFNTVVPNDCDWTSTSPDAWHVITAVTAWTPLSSRSNADPPFPAPSGVSEDSKTFRRGGSYCVRVRAQTDRAQDGNAVWGDFTYLSDAFTFTDYPAGFGRPGMATGDYLAPVRSVVSTQTPYFTWRAIPGAASYFVIVAKDPSFTTIVDYAFTRIPAYAPRDGNSPRTYTDEATDYYWVVLPSPDPGGAGAQGNVVDLPRATFKKQSLPPRVSVDLPASARRVGPPTFRWQSVNGARDYRVQVSQDPNFGTLLDEQVTDSTAYTSTKTYPANIALYVRVRAEDEKQTGLRWSTTVKFRNVLLAPVPDPRPTRGDLIPTFTWQQIPQALSYDFHIDYPDGSRHDWRNLRSPAFTPTSLPGGGVFHWMVRAEFPQAGGGTVPGPYSRLQSFARTFEPPAGSRTVGGTRTLLFVWQPKAGARSYRIQVARSPDFSQGVDSQEVHGTSYAPNLDGYVDGGRFYWRLQAADADGVGGDYSETKSFTLQKIPH